MFRIWAVPLHTVQFHTEKKAEESKPLIKMFES